MSYVRTGRAADEGEGWSWVGVGVRGRSHTPSISFLHLPPNSTRFGYATEGAPRFDYATDGALIISAQLSTDAVSALRKVEY